MNEDSGQENFRGVEGRKKKKKKTWREAMKKANRIMRIQVE